MKKCLITGGLGFIGFNAALHYARRGFSVDIFDDLSRKTARRNHAEFRRLSPARVRLFKGDVRSPAVLERLVRREGPWDLVLHLAGQVAVTSSVAEPRKDFEINALGTLNVLEMVRRRSPKAFVIFASTNKVYGATPWARIGRDATRYFYTNPRHGVDESAPLDFHSPYGCSKGAADQYVRDYARIYGLRTAVFRQSCIYGPWQYGEEDQGWVAWFLIAALSGKPITLFGDGRQVRDVLYVDDLLSLYDKAWANPRRASGEVFNAGGGEGNTLSLLELLDWLRLNRGLKPRLRRADWRPGDQRVYISNIGKARGALRWRPEVSVDAGLNRLAQWLAPRPA
jgi:CDP-paratose 2-epimerase